MMQTVFYQCSRGLTPARSRSATSRLARAAGALLIAFVLTPGTAAQHQHAPAQDRAHQGMGFDQQKTTHHFLIEKAGGTIEVTAKDANDTASTDQIRTHLRHIASLFADGDFSVPMFVHDTTPPGVGVMKERRAQMAFRYDDINKGGKVVIQTDDAAARDALHDFLRFQIREHKTGDPMTPR
jgi:hypothetical protein